MERLLSNTLVKSKTNQSYQSLAAIQSAASSSQLVDILITNVWPSLITNLSAAPLPATDLPLNGVPPLDDVIRRIKPRYQFAAGGGRPPQFWEREPYVWDDEEGRVARFVSLGAFGGETHAGKKPRVRFCSPSASKSKPVFLIKWFYAFSLTPSAVSTVRPTNATKNPFLELAPRPPKRSHINEEGENFIFGNVRQPIKRSRVGMLDMTYLYMNKDLNSQR